jgi:ribosomal protein S18 acetylase RimI-like enzyme
MPTIEHPKEEEIHDVFDFMCANDTAEYGEPDSDYGDLEDEWKEADLAKDVWLLKDNGRICGYSLVSGEVDRFHMDLYAHNDHTPAGWMDRLIEPACERVQEKKESGEEKARLTVYSCVVNKGVGEALLRNGFSIHTWHFRMQIDFIETVEAVNWPDDFEIRPFQQSDEEELYHLIEATFDWQEHVMPPIEEWRKHLFRGGRFDPEYFVLVRKAGKLVGAALSYNEDTLGWIRQLAISKDLQGQGFGSKLLRHMFHVYQQIGKKSVALGVASVNQNACQFYERVGMRKVREFAEYRKEI